MNFEFAVQKEMNGPGHAIYLTKSYIKEDDKLLIIYGDTIFVGDMTNGLKTDKDASLAVKRVDDPRRFGVVEMEGDKIVDVVEKPDYIKEMDAMIGIYFINKAKLLFDALEFMVENNRMTKGEFYLTDAFKVMIEKGNYLTTFQMDGWYDCGKPETLLDTNRYMLSHNGKKEYNIEGCTIIKPVFIDETATIKNSTIGPNVSIGRGVEIIDSKIEDSVINRHSYIEKSILRNSIIGEDALVKKIIGKINIGCHSEITNIEE
jgi:glucose-1-phosphate thymidylyltransferase